MDGGGGAQQKQTEVVGSDSNGDKGQQLVVTASNLPHQQSLLLPVVAQHQQPQEQEGDSSSNIVDSDHQKLITNVDAADRDNNNLEVQTQVPTQTRREPTYLELLLGDEDFELPPYVPEETNPYRSPAWIDHEPPMMTLPGNDVIETAELEPQEQITPGTGSQFLVPLPEVEQDSQITGLNNDHLGGGLLTQSSSSFSSEYAAVAEYMNALMDSSNLRIPHTAVLQSFDALANNHALFDTYALGPPNISGFSPTHQSAGSQDGIGYSSSGLNNTNSEFYLLLEKIKDPENNSIRLINIMGYVAVFSADPFGSRFIQQKLETATTTEIAMVYKEIMPHVRILITDVFANYAIQKLIEYGPTLFRRMLINTLAGSVVDLSLHQYGCRVIQKAFEVSDLDQKIEMANELGSSLMKCVCDQNANHVVQKCVQCVPSNCINFIYGGFRGKAKTLSLHPYGCRVVQRVLECCQDAMILHALVTEIVECVHELFIMYMYIRMFVLLGCIQDVLELGGEFVRSTFVTKFAGRIVDMSCRKYSSNVIEKCLSVGNCQDRLLIAAEILRAGEDTLLGLMMDQHGSYVIQKVLETAEMWQRDMVVAAATRHVGMLTMYAPGRHVVAQVNKLLAARGRRAMQLLSAPTSPLYFHG
ncbi:hypothetical protein ABZP36_009920 [Zizania latifolia]